MSDDDVLKASNKAEAEPTPIIDATAPSPAGAPVADPIPSPPTIEPPTVAVPTPAPAEEVPSVAAPSPTERDEVPPAETEPPFTDSTTPIPTEVPVVDDPTPLPPSEDEEDLVAVPVPPSLTTEEEEEEAPAVAISTVKEAPLVAAPSPTEEANEEPLATIPTEDPVADEPAPLPPTKEDPVAVPTPRAPTEEVSVVATTTTAPALPPPTVAMGVPTKEGPTAAATMTTNSPTTTKMEEEERIGASGCSQVVALMEKNALTKIRTPGATIAELLSPVFLMLVLSVSYNLSEIKYYPARMYHALNVDLPLFWDTGVYGDEDMTEEVDLSDSHRRRLVDGTGPGAGGESSLLDFGLGDEDDEDDETSVWTWAKLLSGLEGGAPEEEFGLVNDMLMMNLFRQKDCRRDLSEMMEVSGIADDDAVMDLDHHHPQDGEEEEDSGDWMEEILTDIKKETVDKVDWDQVVDEIKDNFGEMWDQAKDYVLVSNRRSARSMLDSMRLRLQNVLRRPIVIPTFGQYVWASKLLSSFFNVRQNLPRVLEDSNYGRQWGNLLTLGTIHLAPSDHPLTSKLIQYLEQTYPAATASVLIRVHDDHDTAMTYVMNHLDEERTWAVIDLTQLNYPDYVSDINMDSSRSNDKGGTFTIRLNYTTVPNTALVENYVASGLSTKYQRYFLSGYLTLQRTMNDFVMSLEDGCVADIDPFYTMPMPVAAYDQNVFFLHVGYLLGLVLVMAFLYPTSRLIQSLVEERETRMKETLLILGVRPWAHTTSWVLTSMLTFIFITFFMSVVLQHILTHTPFTLIWFWLGLFGMASMSFCFFLASFFCKAKLAAVVGPMALFATLLPRFVFFGTNRFEAIGSKYLASILPGTALAFGADIVGDYEYGEQSVGDHFWVGAYSFGSSVCFLLFDTIFYMVLAWYTEQVIPREYGAAPKPWYFPFKACLPRSFFSSSTDQNNSKTTPEGDVDDLDLLAKAKLGAGDCVEPVTDPALIPRVFIHDLVKCYNKKAPKPAINHLNLTLYESQITGLLGHNGAGKTSTVSILTGLFPPTSGGVSIYGHSITEDMAKARQSIGICPQHDVLFDRLTVMEHLTFFSKIKGVSYDIHDLKEKALELGLTEDQLRTTAAALSGGNKRKLSVAIALCGDPKFLILDEPTSAMDPTARRRCWQVLRRKREGRVTLLTTHFMDEAEHLSDRVAIVNQGELQCCGSPLYLKDKYNLGWNLTVVMEKPEDVEGVENEYAGCQLRITNFLQLFIPQTELVRRSGRELTFCFPKGSEDLFPEAFDAFEQQSKDLGVTSYGIENASFEEVFLMLAEKDGRDSVEKPDDVSVAETGSVNTDKSSHGLLESDSESVASSKVTDNSGNTSDSDSLVATSPKVVNPLDCKDTTQDYQSMSALRQIGLLYWKRFTVQKRDTKGAFFAIIVPVMLIALVVLVLNVNVIIAGPPQEMSPALYQQSYSSEATGNANTQILVAGGASAQDKTDVQTEYLFMDSGMAHEYQNAKLTHLVETRSSSELSHYLLDTYNDHDRPVRFGAFSIDDMVQLNINLNFTAFREQIQYYENRTSHAAIKLRDQRIDLLELMGVAGTNGRLYWRKSVAELAKDFYSWSSLDPTIKVRTEDLHNLTQTALKTIMQSSNMDLAEIRAQYENGIRSSVDDLYNQVMTFLKSRRFRELEGNVSQIVGNYGDELAVIFNDTDQIESDLEAMIKDFVQSAFEKEATEAVRGEKRDVYRWQGNLTNLVRSFLNDLSLLGEDAGKGIPSIYNATMDFVNDVTELANRTLEEVTASNYTVDSMEDAIINALRGIGNSEDFNKDIIVRAISTMVNGVSELYDLGDVDTTESLRSAVNWVDARLDDYSDGSIKEIPGKAFVAPLILVDYILGKWNMTTISPEEAFGYLSESLGGSRSQLNGFVSVRAKDVVVDLGKLAIDLNQVYVTTGYGTFIDVDKEIRLSFSLDALEDLMPEDSTNMQFQFDVFSKTSLLHNSSSPHAVAAFHQAYMEHRYKQCLGDTRGTTRLVSVNHPLPLTAKQSLEIKVMLSVLAGLFILIPFCYIPATFIVFLVKERVSKSKHLQLVSGVNMSAYWIASYLWDLSLYLLLTMCIMIVFLMYGDAAQVFVGDKDAFLCTFALTFGYGVSSLPFSYLLSRMFDNSSTAQISVAGIGWLTGFVTVISYVTMDSMEKTEHIAAAMQPWFRLFPAYNVGEGLMSMSTAFWYREILGFEQYPLEWDVAGHSICYVFLLALPYFFLVLVLEYSDDGGSGGLLGRGIRSISSLWTKMMLEWYGVRMSVDEGDSTYSLVDSEDIIKIGEDEDVARERQEVLKNSEELRQTAPVVLLNLWKIYPPSVGIIGSCIKRIRGILAAIFCCCCRAGHVDESEEEKPCVPRKAVRGVTTSIKKGETYALLGANGAGKTTTMGMLTGDITSTNGSAYIAGHNATGGTNSGVSEARRNIGFCPQKDPLLDLMTGRETLTMFARLRGIPAKDLDSVVQELLDRLTLTPHADKVTKAYSGGNKRKLSLGLALIGDPKVLLIDESSSGLDPLAKRRMWDLIEEAARSRSVILTTHSMQEAEALCTRVAIMVKGQFVCLGSVQHLKTKYLDGYSVDIFCGNAATDAVVNQVENEVLCALPGAHVSERYGRFMRFEIVNVSCLGLGTCFRRLQELKNNPDLHVENYSVSQCSLENVFVKLVSSSNSDDQNKDLEKASL